MVAAQIGAVYQLKKVPQPKEMARRQIIQGGVISLVPHLTRRAVQAHGPIKTEFGYHMVKVHGRTALDAGIFG